MRSIRRAPSCCPYWQRRQGIHMKRSLISVVAVFFSFVVSASAATRQRVPDVPECRGVATAEIVAQARAAKTDPAGAYAKEHRGSAPASVRCSSALWRAFHKNASTSSRTVAAKSRKKTRPAISPKVSLPLGAYLANASTIPPFATPYAGPPNDFRPVAAVRTPPLRNMHPLPPPRRGDDNNDHGHPEPIRPAPPTQSGGPDTGLLQTAPSEMTTTSIPDTRTRSVRHRSRSAEGRTPACCRPPPAH